MYNIPTYKTPPTRRFVRESRPYDFLYDSTYTVPSRADFLASLKYGTRSGAQQKIRPVFNTMFSAVKTDTRNIACMVQRKPDVIDNFVHQYDVNGVPIIPADTGPLPVPRLVDEVTGANRHKYAIRYGQPSYKLDLNENHFSQEEQKNYDLMHHQYDGVKQTVSKSIQTDYRESECQTDPYSPPYFLPYPGAYPKLLALVKLTWEKGLPFSLDDIVIIERALSKRMLEYVDHAAEDEKDFEKRIKLMEELEAQQWADREKELDKLCQRKMELTNRLLQEYSARVANEHTLRLERLHIQLKLKSQENFQNIKHQYFRDLRKLEKKYLHKKGGHQRDIVKDYTEFDSQVYAPLTREGLGVDDIGEEPTEFHWNINDFDKIDAITKDPCFIKRELTFDVDRFREKIEKCKPTGTTKRLERKLEDIYLSFKDHGMKAKDAMNYMGGIEGRDRSKRASTAEVAIDDDVDEEWRKPHVVLLQKIARGRTIQKLIREEMDKNMSEILGLKRMYDMDPNCQRLEESRLQKLMAMKKNSEADDARDTPVEEVVGHLEGETLAKMIDFLDKEMVRLIDERKIHALILLAERERKLKEAAEGGRRYKEEEARRANDEVFKQITGIHQATVDMYLEEIFLESCDRVADDQSRIYVQKMASTFNDALNSARHTTLSDFEQEELAADLVSSFMVPELHRLYHNSRVEAAGGRYKKAAEQVLHAVFTAHPAASDIIRELEPVVDEHLQRGIAAVDGGIGLVETVITEAASLVVRSQMAQEQTLDEVSKTSDSPPPLVSISQAQSQPKSDSSSSKTRSGSPKVTFNKEQSLDESGNQQNSSDSDFAKLLQQEDSVDSMQRLLAITSDSPSPVDGDKKEEPLELDEKAEETIAPDDSKQETGEMKVEEVGEITLDSQTLQLTETEVKEGDDTIAEKVEIVEEERKTEKPPSPLPSPKLPFKVAEDVIRRLAAKSVQVTYDTEIGQHVESVFSGAHYTVDNFFEEVKQKIGSPRTDESGSDATLSDDTDD